MYFDFLALIRTSYRSTPYPSVSIITVWRWYSHTTLFLWSSSLWVSETEIVGVRERESLQVVNVTHLVSCLFFFFCRTRKGRGGAYRTYMAEMPESATFFLLSPFLLKGNWFRLCFLANAAHKDRWMEQQKAGKTTRQAGCGKAKKN